MKTLGLAVALVTVGCGEMGQAAPADATAPLTCAAYDKVIGDAKLSSVVGDQANVPGCAGLAPTIGDYHRTPVVSWSGAMVSLVDWTADQADSACSYTWTLDVAEKDLSPNLGCEWTVIAALSVAVQR